MTTRTRTVYPATNGDGVESLFASSGKRPEDGLPLGWLETIRPAVERHIRSGNNPNAQAEIDGLRVYGVEHLVVRGPDILTPAEEMAERLAAAEAKLAQLRGLYHADGTPVPDALDRLKRIAGI